LVAAVTLSGLSFAKGKFPGMLDNSAFLLLNWGAFLTLFTICGITFFFSCIFNESSKSIGFSTAVPVVFLLMQMISNAGETYKFLKNITFFTLFDTSKIVAGEPVGLNFLVLFLLGSLFFTAGLLIFRKRDLSV
jgi:ABC-2 type transport system permease protein